IATRSTPPLGGGALRAYRRLLGYLRPYRGRFILGILGGVLFSATMASFALLAKKFGDGTFTHQDPRTIVWVPLALIGLFILRWLNARLTLIALIMGPLVGWLVSVINQKFRRYSRRIQDSMGDVTRVAKEGFEAPRLVKVYNAQEHLGRQFDAVNDRNLRSNMKLVLTKGVSNPTVQLVTVVGLAFVLSIAIADAVHARMSMGDLLGFLTALVSIAQPLRELVGVAGPLQQGIAAAQSLFELLDEPTEPQGGALRVARARGAVEFDRVSFAYGG